jgi:hypothetical protein
MQDFKEMLGLNFNEQHLEDMLHGYYDDERYYGISGTNLIIEGCKPFLIGNYMLSQDKKFLYNFSKGKLSIKSLSTKDPVQANEIITVLTNINGYTCHTLYGNLFYLVSELKLHIFDVSSKQKFEINLPFLVTSICVYDGNIYCIGHRTLLMLDKDGSNYKLPVGYGAHMRNYQDGVLYFMDEKYIHTFNTVSKTIIKTSRPYNLQDFIGTKYGLSYIDNNLVLPSSKIMSAQECGINWFNYSMGLNTHGTKLILTGVKPERQPVIIIIDLESEIIVRKEDSPYTPNRGIGFMSVQYYVETISINLKIEDFKSSIIVLSDFINLE